MRIVIITSSAKALFGLRKELIASWIKANHEVIAIGEKPESELQAKCRDAGFEYRSVRLERNGLNPIVDLRTLSQLTVLLNEYHPDRVFCTFAKAIAYGCWAANKVGIDNTYALVSGLGSGFRGTSLKSKILSLLMSVLYKNAFRCCSKVIFQNNDDLMTLVNRGLLKSSKGAIVNGSGVDLVKFEYNILPHTNNILFVGRLLKEKGIREYIEAAKLVKTTIPDVTFMVVGDLDTNPSSLTKQELEKYQKEGLIQFFGYQDDVRPFLRKTEIFVLPSYHEGTPRCVLEAMSMGKPILTSDAPGCRETVDDGINGYLIPVKNYQLLAERIIFLLCNREKAQEMGRESRRIAETRYDVNKVNDSIFKIMDL